MRRCGIRCGSGPRRNAVSVAVAVVTQIGSSFHHLCPSHRLNVNSPSSRQRTVRVRVKSPLPDISAHVVKAISIRFERPNRRSRKKAIEASVVIRKPALPDVARQELVVGLPCAPGVRHVAQPSARRMFPFGLCGQASTGPFCEFARVVPGKHVPPDDPGFGSTPDPGPFTLFQLAPSTRHHHSAPFALISTESSRTSPAKTNDHPNRSASVLYEVSATNAANIRFVTVVSMN